MSSENQAGAWRPATAAEVRRYYDGQFRQNVWLLAGWVSPSGPKEYAVALQRRSPAADRPEQRHGSGSGSNPGPSEGRFIRRPTRTNDGSPYFETWTELVDFFVDPVANDPLGEVAISGRLGSDSVPDAWLDDTGGSAAAGVYYTLEHWERSWLIVVRIEATTIARERAERRVQSAAAETATDPLAATGIIDAPPVGYPYTFADVEQAIEYGFEVAEIFEADFAAERTMVVYTGDGAHVYLLDDDPAHAYDRRSRQVLVDLLTERYEIPIDRFVTSERTRLVRLPYSLHAGVCRIVRPIKSPEFDFRCKALPAVVDTE